MTRAPRRWGPAVFTAFATLLCLGLGIWQIQRLHWKLGLIAARSAAVSAPPIVPPTTRAQAQAMEFRRVAVTGVLLNGKEILVNAISRDGRGGYHVLTPLREDDGKVVFIDRGFVPTRLKDRRERAAGDPAGSVRVVGLLRVAALERPGWFTPLNQPRAGDWYWVDLGAMAAADGLGTVQPFYIDADASPNPGGWPQGGVTRLTLPNHHLQYSITWFSLAIAAVVTYVLAERRDRKAPDPDAPAPNE
jgi:surfeit locus 1 family protein